MNNVNIINLNAHYDVSHVLYQWTKTLPIKINYYICGAPELNCFCEKYCLWEKDILDDINILSTLKELESILDDKSIVVLYSNIIFESIDKIVKNKFYKKVLNPHGSYAPVTDKVISSSTRYLETYKCINGLYIPKIFNYRFDYTETNKRHNFYSYIRNYDTERKKSYELFSRLHNIIKNYGLTLVNYGFHNINNKYDTNYDVEIGKYSSRSKATIHIKNTDFVSNAVCKSVYTNTPVLMLKEDYIAGWCDNIKGIYTFDTIEEMAQFMVKLEMDDIFFNNIIEKTKEDAKENKIMTQKMIDDSVTWINKILNID